MSVGQERDLIFDANCRGKSGDLFVYMEKKNIIARQEDVQTALGMCAACSVTDLCLEFGKRTHEKNYTIYGGEMLDIHALPINLVELFAEKSKETKPKSVAA